MVQRHRQFDNTKPRAKMTAGDRNRLDRLAAQLIGQLPELLGRKVSDIGGYVNRVEQRCLAGCIGQKAILCRVVERLAYRIETLPASCLPVQYEIRSRA